MAAIFHSSCAANGEQNQFTFRLVQFGSFGLDFADATLELYGYYSFVAVECDQWQNHYTDRNPCQDR